MQCFVTRVRVGTELGMPFPGGFIRLEIAARQFLEVVSVAGLIAGPGIRLVA